MIDRLKLGEDSHWGANAVGAVDHAALARRVNVSTLMICGQADTTWEESRDALRLFPNIQSAVIEGASMDVADEYPEQLVELVDRFLRAG